MRFTWGRWLIATIACSSLAAFVLPLAAAEMRTAGGKRTPISRAAYQEPAEDAPSVMLPQKPTAPKAKPGPIATPEPASSPVMPPQPAMRAPLYREELPWDTEAGSCASGACEDQGDCWVSTWAKVDYLLWWRSGQDLPPLVTTATDGTAQATAGEIGQSTTSVLFGNDVEQYPIRPGGRVELGTWFDRQECLGIGGRFFWLADANRTYDAASAGSPILAIPFTEGSNNTQDARLIAFPNTFNGNLNFATSSEIFGADAYFRTQWCCAQWGRLDLIGGYQYARLNESLTMNSTVSDNLGASSRVIDSFSTRNEFHGGQIGVLANIDRGCYYVDLLGKVGLGSMHQQAIIQGQSISTVGANQTVLNNSGLFAQPTNVGTHSRDQFTAIPELGINVGWRITRCVDLSAGYTVIYYGCVARPEDAIDTTVNTTQAGGTLSGAARPTFRWTDNDFVVHGFNFGVTWRW